jgi:uncharacterized membrane protein YjgN (DUF898 family)
MSEPLNNEVAAATPAAPRELQIEFTGSGSEYFRIWIVNLLLTLVSVGLYFPFAKARRLSYFYSNTLINGQALAFHGSPWKMLRGFLLLAVLMAVYGVAGRLSPVSAVIAFVVLAAVWPALWRASLQFRLGNTSWRGLRFAFRAGRRGAYLAVLPVYAPVALMLGAQAYFGPAVVAQGETMSAAQAWMLFGPLGVLYLLLPWSLALIKRYQHGGYVYAEQQTRMDASTWSFYKLSLKGLGVMLMGLLIIGGLAAVSVFAIRAGAAGVLPKAGLIAALVLIYLIYFALTAPYFTVRMQNLVWGSTHSPAVRFTSALRFWPLARLTLKNWLLTALTLSLYRPFAVVNTTSMRLAAMTISVEGDLDVWVSRAAGGTADDATGDAAGDFFGIDMGL